MIPTPWVALAVCAVVAGCAESARQFPATKAPASYPAPASGVEAPDEMRFTSGSANAATPADPKFLEQTELEGKAGTFAMRLKPAGAAPGLDERVPESTSGEGYKPIVEPGYIATAQENTSTFSIDVDTASYSNMRRFLNAGTLPPVDAVRIEELLNYFQYEEMPPPQEGPFAAHLEIAGCPWNPAHRLAKIGLKGREIAPAARPQCNLVFLIDVSGSMNHPKKLPLVKESLKLLVEQLGEADHIALTVYAGAAGVVLPPTSASRKQDIFKALDRLHAGGSTNGAGGIQLAYQVAADNKIPGGANRVILCTDGDFNVGITRDDDLEHLIAREAKRGVFLTVLGFGMGNLQDAKLERLADRGNGHYGYIDTIAEAKKALVEELSGTLVTIAKDVKIQVEFDKQHIAGYRLIGYENRRLDNQDFANDAKDAGEIGAGHSVTALYELIPQQQAVPANADIMKLRLRYKAPDADRSDLAEFVGRDTGRTVDAASNDYRFASSVAMAGMLLRNSEYRGTANWETVLRMANQSRGSDARGQRAEFITLMEQAQRLTNPTGSTLIPLSAR
ncbi:MAG TPA: VWA domain-containing protein [Planctomycetaceae bacterium]|nr:VWA domain-containing protein [Planctomycetaceae bacterium]